MWLKDSTQRLEGPILRDKLKLDVESVQCAVDASGWLMARIKTKAKHRSNEILKLLMGEEAFKATKQPAATTSQNLDYNLCVPSDGHKIQGADGIQIFPNSKEHKHDFKLYESIIDKIKTNSLPGQYLGKWHDTSPERDPKRAPDDTRTYSSPNISLDDLAKKTHPMLVDQLFDPAMLSQIRQWEEAEQRLKDFEDDDDFEPAHEGVVYWAETLLLPGILKNGGSRYNGNTRVRQLYTAGVPVPFVCVHEMRVPDWKLFEGAVHEYFKDLRVYNGKEFFRYSAQEAIKLTNQIQGLALFSEEERAKWDCALAKVTKRLAKNRAAWAKKQAKHAQIASAADNSKILCHPQECEEEGNAQDSDDSITQRHCDLDASEEGQERQIKRARTVTSDSSALAFANEFLQTIANIRKDAAENATLQVKIAEMKHEAVVKDFTEKLQKAENLRQAAEAAAKKFQNEISQITAKLQHSEHLQQEMKASHIQAMEN